MATAKIEHVVVRYLGPSDVAIVHGVTIPRGKTGKVPEDELQWLLDLPHDAFEVVVKRDAAAK